MNRKKIIIFFSILLIIIAISGYFIIKNIKKNKEETLVQEYIPQEEIGESQARQTIVSLYFPDKEKQEIKPEARLIDIKEIINTPYEKLLEMLIQGPKNDKLERVIPEGTKVLKTYMENDCLVIDFSKDFLNYDMEKENGKNNMVNDRISSFDAFSILATALVVPFSFAAFATSSSDIKQCTSPPYNARRFLFIPERAICVSVTISAPFFIAFFIISTTFSEKHKLSR